MDLGLKSSSLYISVTTSSNGGIRFYAGELIAAARRSNSSDAQFRLETGKYGLTFGNVLNTAPASAGVCSPADGHIAITNGTSTTTGGALSTPDAGELTIATGAVTATGTYHTIDTESDAASDDLDTINGGRDGQILVIQAENGARTVVAKDGTGNLQLNGDFSLDNAQDTLTLMYSGALTAWVELSRSDNGA